MAYILIVDEDPIIAEMASDVLIGAGHACGWVSSAQETMRLLRWRRPDLVMLEQTLRHVSGGQLLRQLRQSAQFYDLPVVMFTAVSGRLDEQQAIYNGANGYIRKPFDPDKMVHTIAGVLDGRKNRPQHRTLAETAGINMTSTAFAAGPRQFPV